MMDDNFDIFFDRLNCDVETKKGTPCRMTPMWTATLTGERMCYVHAKSLYDRIKRLTKAELTEDDPEIVHAR